MPYDNSSRMEFWRFGREERTASYLYIPDDATFDEAMGWLKSQLVYPYQGPVRHAMCEFHLGDDTLNRWKAERRINGSGGKNPF
uniref:Uncharacterized protein n=1 Tax=Leviviridae sp. TaxID=2027243 RepID=A0A514D4B5_9VIRU|nr:MAG: hypothetical protein H2RhizoLitter49907_000002 [Leviviridae sp.]